MVNDNENWKARFQDYQVAVHLTVGKETADRIWQEYERLVENTARPLDESDFVEVEIGVEQ